MNLKKSLTIAFIIGLIVLGAWEMYWRSQGYYPTLDDNKDLWAVQRAKVEKLSNEDVILIGSSRVLFDIQLDEWEAETGRRPIQLASVGSTPLPLFHDIVNNSDFVGNVIVGVTPGLFFSTTFPLAPPWDRAQTRANYYHDRTYAQQINHQLSLPLQKNLAFMVSFEEKGYADEINLKGLLKRIKIGNRIGEGIPPFHTFRDIADDRNVKMTDRTVTDTAFANTIKRVWAWYSRDPHPPEKDATMSFFLKDAKKFKERGGNLILLRCPSSGADRIGENMGLPRAELWDDLVTQANVPGYHFEDYEQLIHFNCPEDSHLSAQDARIFTTELANIMMKDGVLTNSKNN
jgi:hypothetical protein